MSPHCHLGSLWEDTHKWDFWALQYFDFNIVRDFYIFMSVLIYSVQDLLSPRSVCMYTPTLYIY